ncbi:MAG: C4-dicarboxylate ABC transporter, partial [Gammaproteobacteria bacterium]
EAFGIAPIPLTIADVLAGLQTGLINAVTIPPIGAVALQWHTQLDYVLDVPLLYVFGTMVITNSSFSKLAEVDQETVRRLVGAALARIDAQSRADHESALAALQQQGLKLVRPGVDELSEWQSSADAATARMLEKGVVTQLGYDELRRYLREYRSGAEMPAE